MRLEYIKSYLILKAEHGDTIILGLIIFIANCLYHGSHCKRLEGLYFERGSSR